ncbi:MAG: hypothetical protein LBC38_05430 [Oscillospiraceae bacterium]|nr:hypothetical protein [Oscillospiraceae bacterium]
MSRTKRLALTAMLTALSVVLVWLAAVIPTGSAALVAICGIITAVTVMRCGYFWALGHFIMTAALSLLLIPDLGVAMMYITMLGWYPIVKSVYETRISRRALAWAVKLITAAAAVTLWIAALTLTVAGASGEWLIAIPGLSAGFIIPATVFVMLVVFGLYDVALTRVIEWILRRTGGKF